MATLQTYQGKGKSAAKTFYRIQPYIGENRPTIRLGTGRKQAEVAAKAIADLIDSKKANVEPTTKTRQWVDSTASLTVCKALLKHKLIEQLPVRFAGKVTTKISMLADDFIRTRCVGLEEATIVVHKKAKRNLLDCFGDVDINTLKKKDGREFWRWLLTDEKLGENTAKQRLRYARAFYEMAIEDELVSVNPFKARGLSVSQTAAEKVYVDREKIDKVIKVCPTLEWKAFFALIRSIPTRVPSEILEFAWCDVDWDKNQMLIHSPKTRRLGKSARMVPIFETLKPYFIELRSSQNANEEYVFPTLRQNTNPGTTAKKIVKKANIGDPWINFFNSLRATAETDLMDEYGLRRACQWAGNSAATAMKNYALVKKTDFIDAGSNSSEASNRAGKPDDHCDPSDSDESADDSKTKQGDSPGKPPSTRNGHQKSDAKSDAILDGDAKSVAEPASNGSHEIAINPKKKALPVFTTENSASEVGGIGLEPTTSTMSTWRSSQLS